MGMNGMKEERQNQRGQAHERGPEEARFPMGMYSRGVIPSPDKRPPIN